MAGPNKFKIDTAVIAAAGFGARLLPLTLHQSKPMMPIADRPLIHYIVDQIAAGGIRRFVVIINPKFQDIRRYIDYQNKQGEWRDYKFIIVEKKSKGFADSVLAAEKFVGKSHFIVAACDDIIDAKIPPFLSLIKIFRHYHRPVAILREISVKQISQYGVISGAKLANDIWNIKDVVEKPSPKNAPSSLGAIADYVLPPTIFRYIKLMKKSMPQGKAMPAGRQEPTVIDALKFYIAGGGQLLGWVFRGHHFDGGSKIGLLQASSYFSAKHPEMGPAFKKYLKSL